jgi:hypothetical protein
MAIAGPAVSVALGASGFLAGQGLKAQGLRSLGDIVFMAGIINFFLAGFNLLPAFPMDGGRVVRALLTRKVGRLRATYIASRLGKTMAILFGVFGFWKQHWMLVAIAFFIYTAAESEYRLVQMQEAAKSGGFGWEPLFGNPPDTETGEAVEISPPPYGKGPDSTSELRASDRDDPFGLFRE